MRGDGLRFSGKRTARTVRSKYYGTISATTFPYTAYYARIILLGNMSRDFGISMYGLVVRRLRAVIPCPTHVSGSNTRALYIYLFIYKLVSERRVSMTTAGPRDVSGELSAYYSRYGDVEATQSDAIGNNTANVLTFPHATPRCSSHSGVIPYTVQSAVPSDRLDTRNYDNTTVRSRVMARYLYHTLNAIRVLYVSTANRRMHGSYTDTSYGRMADGRIIKILQIGENIISRRKTCVTRVGRNR